MFAQGKNMKIVDHCQGNRMNYPKQIGYVSVHLYQLSEMLKQVYILGNYYYINLSLLLFLVICKSAYPLRTYPLNIWILESFVPQI